MKQWIVLPLALAAGAALAQARPDPSDPKAAVKDRPYESAFKDYRPYRDSEAGRWREANEEVGRLGGHQGHVPQAPSSAKPGAKPPAGGAHGSHR